MIRTLMTWFVVCLVALSAIAAEKPNIVYILADDLGWADVPWHGAAYKMPHLTALAQTGLKLESHYVHPMCSPTRAALMTGRYASRFGVTAAQNPRALPWNMVTMARALKTVVPTAPPTTKSAKMARVCPRFANLERTIARAETPTSATTWAPVRSPRPTPAQRRTTASPALPIASTTFAPQARRCATAMLRPLAPMTAPGQRQPAPTAR